MIQEQIDVSFLVLFLIHYYYNIILFLLQINCLTSRACSGGFNDPEELLPMCYKCSNYSTHLQGNQCPNCQQPYIYSFVSFGKFLLIFIYYVFIY